MKLQLLSAASVTGDGFSTCDFIYDGDVAKWKKWGYSIMLRLAMRVSNVDPAMAATYVTKAVAGGVFKAMMITYGLIWQMVQVNG